MPEPHAPTDRLPETHSEPGDLVEANGSGAPDVGAEMRRLLRRMASPVTVVTCWTDGKPQGATIGSFASLSLSPPLVSFNVQRQGRFHAAITGAAHFAVHALTADQSGVADRFAASGEKSADLFGDEHEDATVPLLAGTQGVLVCRPFALHRTGDHTLVIGQVVEVIAGADAAPLLYHRQRYRSVGSDPERSGKPAGP